MACWVSSDQFSALDTAQNAADHAAFDAALDAALNAAINAEAADVFLLDDLGNFDRSHQPSGDDGLVLGFFELSLLSAQPGRFSSWPEEAEGEEAGAGARHKDIGRP